MKKFKFANPLWFKICKRLGYADYVRIGAEVHEKAVWWKFSAVSRDVKFRLD